MPTFKREPCMCCECKFWINCIDKYNLNWGKCEKGKVAFPEMEKCEEFKNRLYKKIF